ncbi:hypothetical protein STCU_08041 [Strigomonas culicis]|uniref:Uncharacterized protein n=1 Tax=Strigomonas culicis TaxID=28005 RepID=S9U1W2_9TRYP|nr:hypothetical protein STCU_08041 [Strigomonas culicis]|eukprot:EPY22918.1 hypothetical protein STCU_08041 [Strigomonas culicis]
MTSTLATSATRLQKQVSRLDADQVRQLFPPAQWQSWPTGYTPASGVAHFLRPAGVPFRDVLDLVADLQQRPAPGGGEAAEVAREVHRDFASDYTLWCRCRLHDFVRGLEAAGASDATALRRRRTLNRFIQRERTLPDGEVRRLFALPPHAPPHPSAVVVPAVAGPRAAPPPPPPQQQQQQQYYQHTPYAATQDYAMLPVRAATSDTDLVRFSTFPQLRNTLYREFDSMDVLRALSLYTGDDLFYTREAVAALAAYVARRVAELEAAEAAFLGRSPAPPATFSRETPVLCVFGNGRLAFLLNAALAEARGRATALRVRPVQLPEQARQRDRRAELLRRSAQIPFVRESLHLDPVALLAVLPCETRALRAALAAYAPALVLVEPHVGRDYLCELRGWQTVREVLCLGPVDSPAMGSFAYPFLSFGATPGPTTYWMYNDNLHKVARAAQVQMPVDPPHEAQGYRKEYLDDLSSWLLSCNDCPAVGQQCRAVRFVRETTPVLRPRKGGDDSAATPPAAAPGP